MGYYSIMNTIWSQSQGLSDFFAKVYDFFKFKRNLNNEVREMKKETPMNINSKVDM